MKAKDNKEALLDFDLLKRLVVGIGEVSSITDVPTRKLRYWEDKGFIKSEGTNEGETRKYNYMNIKKIMLIKELIDDGYTLDAAAQKVEKRLEVLNKTFSDLAK